MFSWDDCLTLQFVWWKIQLVDVSNETSSEMKIYFPWRWCNNLFFFTINLTVFTIEFDKYYNKIKNRKAALNPVRRENQCSTKSRLFHVTVSFIHLSIVYISILEQRVLVLLLKWMFQKSCASTLPKCLWIKCQRLLFTNQPCAAVWFQLFWYFWFHSKTFFECHSRLFVLKRTIQFVWIIAKVFIVNFFL